MSCHADEAKAMVVPEPVVVFCSYGLHVGCRTAIALRDLGFDAKFMTGGHSAWKAIAGPTKPCA